MGAQWTNTSGATLTPYLCLVGNQLGRQCESRAETLGHKTAVLTLDRYGHLFPDDLDAVADAFDSAADGLRTVGPLRAVAEAEIASDLWGGRGSNPRPTDYEFLAGVTATSENGELKGPNHL